MHNEIAPIASGANKHTQEIPHPTQGPLPCAESAPVTYHALYPSHPLWPSPTKNAAVPPAPQYPPRALRQAFPLHMPVPYSQLSAHVGRYCIVLSHPIKSSHALLDAHGTEIEGMPCFRTPIRLQFLAPLGTKLILSGEDEALYESFTCRGKINEPRDIRERGDWVQNLQLAQLDKRDLSALVSASWGPHGCVAILNAPRHGPSIYLSDVVVELARFGVDSLTISACRALRSAVDRSYLDYTGDTVIVPRYATVSVSA